MPHAASADYASGEAAFAARDWKAAKALWQAEAGEGSATALLGLGNLADLGRPDGRDPDLALSLYRQAAAAGLPEAAFNVGAMLEARQGPCGALPWYACAALGGHRRAQYAAGQIHASGMGVAANPDFARDWFQRAADALPAAAAAAGRIAGEAGRRLDPPEPLEPVVMGEGQGRVLCLAWSVGAQPADASFRVEIAGETPDGPALVSVVQTGGSAVRIDVPAGGGLQWRVVSVTASAYAASSWQPVDAAAPVSPPKGAVRFVTRPNDRRAAVLADRLALALSAAGMIVRRDRDPSVRRSGVSYRYPADADLAEDIAGFLPGLEGRVGADATAAPGEVVVTLSTAPPSAYRPR